MKFSIYNHNRVEASFVPETAQDVAALKAAGIEAQVDTSVNVPTISEEYRKAKEAMIRNKLYTGKP